MTILLIIGVLAALAAGWGIVELLWPDTLRRNGLPLRVVLGAGAGVGLTSCAFFICLAASGGRVDAWWMAETALLVLSGLFIIPLLRRKWRRNIHIPSNDSGVADRNSFGASDGIFLVLWLAFAWVFLLHACRSPHGGWDAWAMWNQHARFLYRGGPHWTDGFDPIMTSSPPDYPLLLPASVARLWAWTARETPASPMLLAALFTLGAPLMLYLALRLCATPLRALAGAIVLMGTPFFVLLGSQQYADVPLACCILGATALLLIREQLDGADRGILRLSGLFAAMAAWTKNEGMVFAAALVAVHALAVLRRYGMSRMMREASDMLLGAAPVIAVLLFFKIAYAPTNYLLARSGVGASVSDRLLDFARWPAVLRPFAGRLMQFGDWRIMENLTLSPIWIMPAWLLLTGTVRPELRRGAGQAAIVLTLMLVSYIGAYLVSPHDAAWHVISSCDRLLIQLWPTAILLFFFAAGATPRERLRLLGKK